MGESASRNVNEKFVLLVKSDLSLASGPVSWKVGLEPCFIKTFSQLVSYEI